MNDIHSGNIIGGIGEDELIARLLHQVPVGEGAAGPCDDCAVIECDGDTLQLLKTDAMVEGVHWARATDAKRVGWKAAARVISDMAAMGGRARQFLITIAMPPATPLDWATGLYRGIGSCLEAHEGVIAGGETTSCPDGAPIVISVAASGEVRRDQLTLRSGGNPGDLLLVTGTLGGSIAGKHLDFKPRLDEAAWLTANHKPTAMMDLSDGLAKDLPRLARASGCGFKLHQHAIPCTGGCSIDQAIADGEDYELLFTIPADRAEQLLEAWQRHFSAVKLSVIGELCSTDLSDSLQGGWDHFAP